MKSHREGCVHAVGDDHTLAAREGDRCLENDMTATLD
jgi:hypothetical protein